MEGQALAQWQELHRRSVNGETLTAAERRQYEQGCAEVEDTVRDTGGLENLRQNYALLQAMRKERDSLLERERQQTEQIAALEKHIDDHLQPLLTSKK